MSPEQAALVPLAESIADGSSVDWEAAEARASADERAIIRQLRVLSTLAALHRSLPSGSEGSRTLPATGRPDATPAIGSWAHLALVGRLGGGAFGDVYRAWDRQLEREVALKLLRVNEPNDDPQTSRIAMEGRLLARMRHPNVVTVHGVAIHDQRVGLWMELIRGVTLEQLLLKRGTFGAREAAVIGIDLCRALAAIHAAGLIHRDIKAQNVMREDGGRIVLMDLGAGREIDPSRRQAWADLAGTPLYFAPELFSGAPASERSDLYSLGVLLYHLVTGSFPVRATTIDELQERHATGTCVRLRDARADLPTAFVRVVDRAIATDPQRRYESAGALEADLVASLDDTADAPAPPTAGGHPRTPWLAWRPIALVVAAMAAALALAALEWPRLRESRTPVVAPGAIRSIAVLPLANLSGDPSQEYFADGMTDEIIATLGQLGGLDVISRTSSMQFKGSGKPLPEIARALHVDGVLEGSVLVLPGASPADPKRVRINARLIEAGVDRQLWNRTFETVVADVFMLQSDVARAVADGINFHLTSKAPGSDSAAVALNASRRSGGSQDFAAFDLYLRGRYQWNMRTEQGLNRSIEYFRNAIDRDPTYALAYAGLADAYNLLGLYGFMQRGQANAQARAAAARSLDLDSSLAEAHTSLGLVHMEQFEWDAADAEFKRALALKPAYATAHHWYADYLAKRGRTDESLLEIGRALALDPFDRTINSARGVLLILARRYSEAVAQFEQMLRTDPGFADAHTLMAEALTHQAAYDQALAELDKAAALGGGNVGVRANMGYTLALAGRRAEALKVAGELADDYRLNQEAAAAGAAFVYIGLNEKDRAFEWLNRAREVHDSWIAYVRVDPKFDNLRADPRFEELLASVGLAQ